MKGLGLTKAGVNPMLYLGLSIHPARDPECYLTVAGIRAFRGQYHAEFLAAYASEVANAPAKLRKPGPLAVMWDRLERLGWQRQSGAIWLTEGELVVDLLATPFNALHGVVCRSFQTQVGQRLAHRKGFEGLQHVDAAMSASARQKLNEDEDGLLRALQIGTFITADQTGHFSRTSPEHRVCKFCQQPDSLEHRRWQCHHMKDLREALPPDTQEWIRAQPLCAKERGWATQIPECQEYQKVFQQLDDSTGEFLQEGWGTGMIYAFTDGSGIEPQVPQIRLVAWSWVTPGGSDQFLPIAAGGVPGMQTVIRAEGCAVVSALKYAVSRNRPLCIVSDNQLVVTRLRAARKHTLQLHAMTADLDVWTVVAELVDQLLAMGHDLEVVKVYSHQEEMPTNAAEAWLLQGNAAADSAAQHALSMLPRAVTEAQQQASVAYHAYVRHYHKLIRFIVAVGQRAVDTAETVDSRETVGTERISRTYVLSLIPGAVQDDSCFLTDAGAICLVTVARKARGRLPNRLVWQGTGKLLDWLGSIQEPQALVEWVAFSDLMVHCQLTTGYRGVRCAYRSAATANGNSGKQMPILISPKQ